MKRDPGANVSQIGALLILLKLIRGETRISGKVLLVPLLQQEGTKTSNRFPSYLPKVVPYMD